MKSLPTAIALIVLILILVSLLYPAVTVTMSPGGRSQAKNDVTQLVVATKGFISEYGTFPTGNPQSILHILQGNNHRKIVFIELDPKRLSKAGDYLDSWGMPYVLNLSGPDSPQVYSFGKNKRDEKGNGDDVASWK